MEFTPQQLEMMKRMASNFRPIEKVARVLGVSAIELKKEIKKDNSVAGNAYTGEFEKSYLLLIEEVKASAMRGSSPAQQMLLKIADHAIIQNI